MKKLTVTIGIPAYNEESNISNLISSVLLQEQIDFKVEQILVVSDGSIDKTGIKVKQFKDQRVKLINNKIRKGQIFCQNLIFSQVKSDAAIILEADTYLKDTKNLHKLVRNLIARPETGLVQGNFSPVAATSFIGQVINFQQVIYREVIIEAGLADQRLCSGRGGRAFSKKIYKNLRWPTNVPEDVFALFWCRDKKIKVYFEKNATSLFKSPQTIEDLIKQRQKINSSKVSFLKYFDEVRVDNFYHIPSDLYLKMLFIFLLKKPYYCLIYLLINFYVMTKISKKPFSDFWPTTSSTKLLS